MLLSTRSYVDLKPLEQFCCCLIVLIAICMRNVATGTVLSLLLLFFCLLVLAACFCRNKDAYYSHSQLSLRRVASLPSPSSSHYVICPFIFVLAENSLTI